jgi:hypothetical protein
MKEKIGKPAGMFFIMGIPVLCLVFSACDTPLGGYWEYEFSNQTQYSITVSLNKKYKLAKEGAETDSGLDLYYKSSVTVYIDSDSVNFEWTAGYSEYNRHIYAETGGSKVTFREKAK